MTNPSDVNLSPVEVNLSRGVDLFISGSQVFSFLVRRFFHFWFAGFFAFEIPSVFSR